MVVDPGTKQGVEVVLLLEHSRSTSNNLILGSRLASKFSLEAWAEEMSSWDPWSHMEGPKIYFS